jgi:hypothetical protein
MDSPLKFDHTIGIKAGKLVISVTQRGLAFLCRQVHNQPMFFSGFKQQNMGGIYGSQTALS